MLDPVYDRNGEMSCQRGVQFGAACLKRDEESSKFCLTFFFHYFKTNIKFSLWSKEKINSSLINSGKRYDF